MNVVWFTISTKKEKSIVGFFKFVNVPSLLPNVSWYFLLVFVNMCITKQQSLCVSLSVHVSPSVPIILHVCL